MYLGLLFGCLRLQNSQKLWFGTDRILKEPKTPMYGRVKHSCRVPVTNKAGRQSTCWADSPAPGCARSLKSRTQLR